MRTLVNRVSALGAVTSVLAGLSLAAVVEQAMFPTNRSVHEKEVIHTPGPIRSKPHSTRPSRSGTRVSPAMLLSRQVEKTAAAQRGPVARHEYGVGTVSAPVVRVSRMTRTWAFGTEAIPAPSGSSAAPEPSLFLARADGPHWTIALAGTPEFSRLISKAPTSVLHANERAALKRYRMQAKKTPDPGLMLPWRVGQSWSALPAASGAWGFNGGDGRVLAAGDGILYRLCSSTPNRGLVLIVHPNGLATEYDQMDDLAPIRDGDMVKQGAYLGHTGTDQPCGGGQAPTRQVRFALRDANGPIPLDQMRMGGWVLHSASNQMFAERDGVRVDVGNPLLNFGNVPLPAPSGKPARKPTGKPAQASKAPSPAAANPRAAT